MSRYMSWQTATIDFSEDDDLSDEVNLQNNCEYMQVILPTLDSCTVSVQVSSTSGGTFQALGSSVATGTTTGDYSTTFKVGGYQYIKIATSAAQTADRSISVRGIKI